MRRPAAPTPGVRAVAAIPSSNLKLGEQERFLVVTQALAPGTGRQRARGHQRLPRVPAARAGAHGAAQDVHRHADAGAGARRVRRLLLAIALSNQLAQPLLLLAEGVSQVARGDFSSKAVFESHDELGGLTRSFAEMTEQLSEARELVHKSVAQVEGARANLQTILDNLTAGVIVFDRKGAIDTVNPGATRILRLPLSAYRGRRLEEVTGLGDFAQVGLAALRAARGQPRGGRARPLAGLVRAADRRRRDRARARLDHAARARRGDAAGRAPDGLRRHHRARLGAARRGLERGRAPARARDQEPADADPALGRAARAEARRQARARRPGNARALGLDDRQPGAGDEGAGQRVPRLRAPAGVELRRARRQRPRRRGARPLRRGAGGGPAPRRARRRPCRRSSATAPSCAR